ncbi:mechanosensitive ion channel family protein [Candidatus Caldatribacterium sp. SIUC1]|uniref:mechanosensitive ion channel family protein n=1 Tax=Candidatus Caldatribacterium sp. SIUC1 TaxID=3418365 RepID=UPI003F68CF55
MSPFLERVLHIGAIIGFSWILVYTSRFVFRQLFLRRLKTPEKQVDLPRKLNTLLPLFQSVVTYLVVFFALVLILREIGIDATAILAGAGVVGIAVGFGAQTLIRDILTGLFLVFEDSLSVGDTVQVGDITGTVEEIGLRITRIRTLSGALVTIPNGEISRIVNYNRGFSRAVVEVSVAYEVDIDRAVEVLQRVVAAYQESHPNLLLGEPSVQRIVRLEGSGVVLRVVVQVLPQKHWEVERDLLYHIKKAFDAEHIEIPYPKYVVFLDTTRKT